MGTIDDELLDILDATATDFVKGRRPGLPGGVEIEDPDTFDQYSARLFVKNIDKAVERLKTRLVRDYAIDLRTRTSDRFWPKWIEGHKKISAHLKRFPYFTPLLDYLFGMTALPGTRFDKIQALAGGRMHTRIIGTGPDAGKEIQAPYACFQVSENLYKRIERNVSVTDGMGRVLPLKKENCKKYIKALVCSGVLLDLGRPSVTEGKVYADGWYHTDHMGKRIKYPFLRESKETKDALLAFSLRR